MKRIIDQNNWNRKEHFDFFSSFDEPFFGIVSEIDCTIAYRNAKSMNASFFLWYLHKSIMAVNMIEEFRYRLEGDKIVCFDEIHASSTIGRDDNTFAYSFIRYSADFEQFVKSANNEIEAVKSSAGLRLNEDSKRIDTIHYTSLPWFKLTGMSHPRNFRYKDSVPKISFGKCSDENGRNKMSIAIHAHHGLMDGYHIGKYLDLFQKLMNE